MARKHVRKKSVTPRRIMGKARQSFRDEVIYNLVLEALRTSQEVGNIGGVLTEAVLWKKGYEDPDDITTLTLAQQEKLRENRKKDAKALYFIQVAVSTSIFPRIIGANRSKEAWDSLKNEFQGSEKIIMGNGSIVKEKCKGTVAIQAKEATTYIRDVLLVPDLEQNLLSVGQLVEHGYMVYFEDNGCKIYDKSDGKKFMTNVKMEKSRNFPISFNYPRFNALKVEVKNESRICRTNIASVASSMALENGTLGNPLRREPGS
ncbi:hypothetical protein RJ640_013027 [Escallonia rubra]|uniref:Retrovirus-related Pol polyprotein from transposon TNT 1-94-like beta-barrel domain-containing protein n=1 Tax=Escallonia rubra TaxID=112253 RepID=A0AA88UKL6_9ASTE|nr:hypothetical protein RJ640_013027 [Escallonia rubra]